MADERFDSSAFQQLQSKQTEFLDDIDKLRSQGIGRYVDLPQLIVCGNQSSGKSSVLEAISRVRFPTESSLCTRFATELILRRAPTANYAVSITPGHTWSDEERQRMKEFESPFNDAEDFPAIVKAAKDIMGLKEKGPKTFSDDVLRVEVSGPDQPHLTLVDLPGLIDSAPREEDIKLVKDLVKKYMKNPRSVILAVVAGGTDIANQGIIQLVKKYDPEKERTIGIITKPDLLPEDSSQEREFLELAKNEVLFLELGWHVLRNRDFKARSVTSTVRDEYEAQFLSRGVWSNIQSAHKGIGSLRRRLSEILLHKISTNLPSLTAEIKLGRDVCRDQLNKLGDSRQTTREQRQYLTKISGEFQKLVHEAREGYCADKFFDDSKSPDWASKRLRAVIHALNDEFTRSMHQRGHKRQVTRPGSPFSPVGSDNVAITREELIKELDGLAQETRDTALPGFANARLVRNLFQDQSTPWKGIAERHIMEIWTATRSVLRMVLDHVCNGEILATVSRQLFDPWFGEKIVEMEKMLGLLLKPHQRGNPITYNLGFLVNTRLRRTSEKTKQVQKTLSGGDTPGGDSAKYSWSNIEQAIRKAESTDSYSSSDIILSTEAYYEVSNLNPRNTLINTILGGTSTK
jgi:hypothetical protein